MPGMNAAITLQNISIAFGHEPVLRGANIVIERGARCCITGYNGSGKSTLLGLIAGRLNPDEGVVKVAAGLSLGLLDQNAVFPEEASVFDVVAGGLGEIGLVLGEYSSGLAKGLNEKALLPLRQRLDDAEAWQLEPKVRALLQQLMLSPDQRMGGLSGGWLKRVAVARSLAAGPDIWLLDEPTNHLDIPTIDWLTEAITRFAGTVVFISHDRRLMQQVADQVIDIDRGQVKAFRCGYDEFVARREADQKNQLEAEKQFDAKLAEEEIWIRQGIKARRTRNEGRVRALEALRKTRAERLTRGSLTLEVDAGHRSGKVVCEFTDVDFGHNHERLVEGFSWVVQRGDRIGLVGPNGVGKSTLIKLMLGQLTPDRGSIKQGTKLDVAYFDQGRAVLQPEMSVVEYIGKGRDFIEINGRSVHVVSYLKRFMFDSVESRGKIKTLSGGQQNRLLLAQLFTQPANFLVLDEPTNDLDVETLELLEELLMEYEGTVMLVSHDRAFLDQVVTSLLVFKGEGKIEEHVGGFSDWIDRGGALLPNQHAVSDIKTEQAAAPSDNAQGEQGRRELRAEQRRLKREVARLEKALEASEAELRARMTALSDPNFFQQSEADQKLSYARVADLEKAVSTLFDQWAEAEAAADAIKID